MRRVDVELGADHGALADSTVAAADVSGRDELVEVACGVAPGADSGSCA